MVTADSPALGAGQVCARLPWIPWLLPRRVDGIGRCARVFFLALMYLCPNFLVLCLGEDGWGGRLWSGQGNLLYQIGQECVSPGFLKGCRQDAGRAGVPQDAALEALGGDVALHASVITWHPDSAIKEEVGKKATDTSGNSCSKEAVKRVIRQIQ